VQPQHWQPAVATPAQIISVRAMRRIGPDPFHKDVHRRGRPRTRKNRPAHPKGGPAVRALLLHRRKPDAVFEENTGGMDRSSFNGIGGRMMSPFGIIQDRCAEPQPRARRRVSHFGIVPPVDVSPFVGLSCGGPATSAISAAAPTHSPFFTGTGT